MKNTKFEKLEKIYDYHRRVRKYYWTAAILFWLGAAMTIQYYIVRTGTEPSWIPGILMVVGATLYFVVRRINN